MKHLKVSILSLLIGLVLGCIAGYILPDLLNPSKAYVTKCELELDNNMVIPKNTKISRIREMPEGFVTYAIYINMFYPIKDKLEEVKIHADWIHPYWVTPLPTIKIDSVNAANQPKPK